MNAENTILYFWDASCSICEPLYDKLEVLVNSEFPLLELQKIDTVSNPELRAQYKVFSSPLILFILDGKEYLRTSGSISLHELKEKINRLYQLRFEN